MTLLMIALNSLIILLATLITTRISGLRTFAKMSSIDFATTIAIGSVIASTILSSKTSLMEGSIALISIIVFQLVFARVIKKSELINKLFTNKPILLMIEGKILTENLDRCGVSKSDLIAKLREANALDFDHIKAVIFETTGDVSVLHSSSDEPLDSRLFWGVEISNT